MLVIRFLYPRVYTFKAKVAHLAFSHIKNIIWRNTHMKKLRILAAFVFTLVLFNISTTFAFAKTVLLDQPYAHIESKKLSFDCSAYESQQVAKKNPTIVYTDTLPIVVRVYTVDRCSGYLYDVGHLISGYGTQFVYTICSNDYSAYVYLDVKPLSEKPKANTNKTTNNNSSKPSSSSKTSSSASSKATSTTSSKADSSSASTATLSSSTSKSTITTEKVDFTPVLEQLGKSVDKTIVLSDLDDFANDKWDGLFRNTENYSANRFIRKFDREYSFNDYSANIDYTGNLPKYPCDKYTLVQNGNTIEEWRYFKKINSWNIPTTDTITRIDAFYSDKNKSYGIVFVTDTLGKSHWYDLYANGKTKKI